MPAEDSLFTLNTFECRRAFAPISGLEGLEELPARDRAFLETVFNLSPYLLRIARTRTELISELSRSPADQVLDRIREEVERLPIEIETEDELARRLRELKGDAHLVHGLGEISGALDVMVSARRLSEFADATVRAGLEGLIRLGILGGKLDEPEDWANPLPGVFLLALGKLGAEELNYSSDIDLVAFFDLEKLKGPFADDPMRRLPRLIKSLSRLLQEDTAAGYVFRVDLRLRPDPSSTPPIVSVTMAMNYYESQGQNWERAAYIKARACAGDLESAAAFLADLAPFTWRRTLDYAAVDDIHSLALQIQSVGDRAKIQPAGHDLKLGRGGIREIEFSAQIPQLVMGGRQPQLRVRSPYTALGFLAEAGLIKPDAANELGEHYRFLRMVEHRLQMMGDEHTQELPSDNSLRETLAVFCGFDTLEAFDQRIVRTLQSVHSHFSADFGKSDSLADEGGSLVFTGVEPTKDTLQTLESLGFQFPETAWARMNAWLSGQVRALRTTRARELLTRIAPRLLRAMSETGEADSAFTRFAGFLEGLPIGIQPLSLLENEPELARELIAIMGLAPRMATVLAQRPAVIDVMLDTRFFRPVRQDPDGELHDRMAAMLTDSHDSEDAMNRARRFVREEHFRIGSQLLVGRANALEAGKSFGKLADITISAMAGVALSMISTRFGPPPGQFAVLAMGKLGSQELAADSDLDIMLIYAPHKGDENTAPGYFTRFAQRLVSALSAPTEEGNMYQIDMQLRPSGKAGPIAVRLSSFQDYYSNEAWTWERMALTRARAIMGDTELIGEIGKVISNALMLHREASQIVDDALDMRRRLERERPAKTDWDLKHRAGGIIDIEFIAQTGTLLLAQSGYYKAVLGTDGQLRSLAQAGLLTTDEADSLCRALALWLNVSQIIRTAHGSGFDPSSASSGFARRLSKLTDQDSLTALIAEVERTADGVRELFELLIGKLQPEATEKPGRFVQGVRGNNRRTK